MLAFILLIAPVVVPFLSIIAVLELLADWHWHLALTVPGLILLAILGFWRTGTRDVYVRALALMNIGMAADLCLGHLVEADSIWMYDWIPLTFLMPLPWGAVMWFRCRDEESTGTMRHRAGAAATNTLGMALLSIPMLFFSYPVWLGIWANASVTRLDNIQIMQSLQRSPVSYSFDDRKFLKHLLQARYIWYDENRVRQADSGKSLGRFFRSTIDPLDKWSYFESDKDYLSDKRGDRKDAGIMFSRVLADQIRVLQVEPGSPAARSGLRRGDAILAVNGVSVSSPGRPWASQSQKDQRTLTVARVIGGIEEISFSKGDYRSINVGVPRVFDIGGRRVGYLQYDDFTEIAFEPLTTAMRTLRQQNISELILDLRYNGGGSAQMIDVLAGRGCQKFCV